MAHKEKVQLPFRGEGSEVLPQELDKRFFELLDEDLARSEEQIFERTLGGLENRGFFRSGETLRAVSEDVLGPSIERRERAIIPLAREAAGLGREERLGELNFQRQRQFADEEADRRVQELTLRSTLNRELLNLQHSLEGGDGFEDFLGSILGTFAGGFAGGAGAQAGKKLFT